MNKFGRLAMSQWQEWAPARYAAIPDPQTFFSTLGQEVEDRVQELTGAPPTPQGEYLQAVGALNMTRLVAEEQALSELVYSPVHQDRQDQDHEDDSHLDWVNEVHQAMGPAYRGDSDLED